MIPTKDGYKAELDQLAFSQATKERMAQRLQDAQDARQTGLVLVAGGQTGAGAKPRTRRTWLRVAAIAAGLAVAVAGGTGVAVAAGVLPAPSEVLAGILGSSPAQTEVIDKIGRPIGASATSGGITVTADAVIGDAHSYTVVFSISREDGSPIDLSDVTQLDNGCLTLGFAKSHTYVTGEKGMIGSARYYDADPSDNSIQYVEAADNVTTFDGQGIVGRTMHVRLGDLVAYSENAEPRTVVEGTWNLDFELNYEDASVVLPTGQTVDCNGYQATVRELSVSPTGVHITYELPEGATDDPAPDSPDGGMLTDKQEEALDRIYGMPIFVTYADGSTEDLATTGGQCDGNVVDKSVHFAQIHGVGDIASVTVGGVTVDVSQ